MFTSWRAGWLSCLFRKAPQHGGNGGQLARIMVYQGGHKFRHLLPCLWSDRRGGLAGYLNDVR